VVFMVVRIALIAVKGILKKITHIPVIRQLDKSAGALFGALEGVMIVFMAFTIVSLLSSLPACRQFIFTVKHSLIASFFYENNFITNWLTGNVK